MDIIISIWVPLTSIGHLLPEIREPIWWAILGWIQSKGLPYPVANIASSAVFFLGVHVLARRQPDPLGFLVLLFPILIINMPMSGIRQGAAIGLLCIAFVAFIDRRPLWFAFWVVLAAGFHTSVLIFMLLLPVATGKYTRNRLLLAAFLAIPGAFALASGEAGELATSRYIGTGTDAAGRNISCWSTRLVRHAFLFVSAQKMAANMVSGLCPCEHWRDWDGAGIFYHSSFHSDW